MKEIRFVDTTLRDGHQSLWAENMTTGMMLPTAERLDNAGFLAMELISGSHVKKSVRELGESPWERIRLMRKRITKTPLRTIAGKVNTFGIDPPAVYKLFLKSMADCGIRQARILDSGNDPEGWKRRVTIAREVGLDAVLDVCFSVSKKHTDEYFAERTRAAAALPVMRLCLKDPGGLLTPERVRTLVPVMMANANGIPIELHSHCTTGLGPLNALEAMKLGIDIINTAIPPLADSSSLPSIFNVARNARALGFDPKIDEELIRPVSDHLMYVAKREGFPIGMPAEYDYAQYLHQVPGGMISNLGHQLKLVGLEDRLAETLEESVRVRAEFGYPIMVTPLSQFVGTQAALNIISGERYKLISDQTIEYALGRHGKDAITDMDPDIRDRVLGTPRAKELARWVAPDPSMDDLRRIHGGPGVPDEEVMLRILLRREEIAAIRSTPPVEYVSAGTPLVALVDALSKRADCSRVQVRKPGFSLVMEKRAAP